MINDTIDDIVLQEEFRLRLESIQYQEKIYSLDLFKNRHHFCEELYQN